MRNVLIINVLLIACHVTMAGCTTGVFLMLYCISRVLSLSYILYQSSGISTNSKKISLYFRRLAKAHFFWYEMKWVWGETFANLASIEDWKVEEEVKGDTFIDSYLLKRFTNGTKKS